MLHPTTIRVALTERDDPHQVVTDGLLVDFIELRLGQGAPLDQAMIDALEDSLLVALPSSRDE